MGAAVQSHGFSVGSIVIWAEAGVGVVATQSMTNPGFGPEGLRLLGQGMDPPAVAATLTAGDPGREMRQLAVLDHRGQVAALTGKGCIPAWGERIEKGFSGRANMMVNNEVWPAMARAFEGSEGPLAERLVVALEAAQAEGGDLRGSQSAALLVVRGTSSGKVWEDRLIDLRVEDHPEPVAELRRLLQVHRAYDRMNWGDQALERGDMASALHHYQTAQESYPDNEEMMFWRAAMLTSNDRFDEALPLFAEVFGRNPRWRDAVPSLVRLGHVRATPEEVMKIISL
jgi:uncharacterized Ntn-hydrolase superfamily protein